MNASWGIAALQTGLEIAGSKFVGISNPSYDMELALGS